MIARSGSANQPRALRSNRNHKAHRAFGGYGKAGSGVHRVDESYVNTLDEIEAWFSGVDRFFDGMLVLMDDRRRRPSRTDR
jgi:hypothetical protein